MDIYEEKNYKNIIKLRSEQLRQLYGQGYSFSKICQHARIQKTFFSKVMNTPSSNISREQFFSVIEYLRFDDLEREYCMLVFDFHLSSNQKYKLFLETKMSQIRKQRQKTSSWLNYSNHMDDQELKQFYYSSPHISMVHLLLTIPKYQRNVNLIKQIVRISDSSLHATLERLKSFGLLNQVKQDLVATTPKFHLNPDDPMYQTFSKLRLLKSLERLNELDGQNDYTYSAYFTASEDTVVKMRETLLGALKSCQTIASAAPSEGLYQLDINLFGWADSE